MSAIHPHLETYQLICDLKQVNFQYDNHHRLCIFSTEKRAEQYLKTLPGEDFLIYEMKWEDVMIRFGNKYAFAVVDHEGFKSTPKFYETIPLQ